MRLHRIKYFRLSLQESEGSAEKKRAMMYLTQCFAMTLQTMPRIALAWKG